EASFSSAIPPRPRGILLKFSRSTLQICVYILKISLGYYITIKRLFIVKTRYSHPYLRRQRKSRVDCSYSGTYCCVNISTSAPFLLEGVLQKPPLVLSTELSC
ncbi:hypothetical protein PZA11_005677, partial [Diplocarpon coronariae]